MDDVEVMLASCRRDRYAGLESYINDEPLH